MSTNSNNQTSVGFICSVVRAIKWAIVIDVENSRD